MEELIEFRDKIKNQSLPTLLGMLVNYSKELAYLQNKDEGKKKICEGKIMLLKMELTELYNKKSDVRKEVEIFSHAMEKELKENDYKGGWKDCTVKFLSDKLEEEVSELLDAVDNGNPINILSESADVANIAMMIADIYGGLKKDVIK